MSDVCRTPKCKGLVAGGGRGVCAICYQAASRYVKLGKATWEELEKLGLVDPPRKGKKAGGLFLEALSVKQHGK